MKIVADELIPFIKDYFTDCGELVLKSGRSITKDDVKDADILLVRSVTRVNKALLANSKIRFVGSVTAGQDHLDTKWLDEAKILWHVAKGFNALSVADYVVSVIAALRSCFVPGKAAVIGVGNIGRLVVERLKLLGFEVILCDPLRAETESDFVSVPINAIHDVDLITLHLPLTKSGAFPSLHMIDDSFLKRQKPNCVLLNTSRGAIIDSQALLACGSHLKWCFDVWEREPHIDQKILKNALIATPHIAGYSVQSKVRGVDIIYSALCNQFAEFARFADGDQGDQFAKVSPLEVSRDVFSGENEGLKGKGINKVKGLSWERIVLEIFDPLALSERMKEALLASCNKSEMQSLFDGMRKNFNDRYARYELGFCKVRRELVAKDDLDLVQNLGVKVVD